MATRSSWQSGETEADRDAFREELARGVTVER
jgi:hypothetical protein